MLKRPNIDVVSEVLPSQRFGHLLGDERLIVFLVMAKGWSSGQPVTEKLLENPVPKKSQKPGLWQNPFPKNPGIDIPDPALALATLGPIL